MQILLLRIGIDLGTGGALGPIFPDGSFEYIPIPESKPSSRSIRYSDIIARSGGCTLDQFVPPRYCGTAAHLDPEFETFTYGDPTKYKRGQLLRLRKGILRGAASARAEQWLGSVSHWFFHLGLRIRCFCQAVMASIRSTTSLGKCTLSPNRTG